MSLPSTSLLLLGLGRMGRIHLREWLTAPRRCAVGVVDPRELPSLPLGIAHFRDLASALRAHPHATAAIIATPDHTHFALAQQCLQAGLSVLLEKPACPTFAQAQELDTAFARAGKLLFFGHCEQFQPVFLQLLRELPRIGELRELATVRIGPAPEPLPASGVALDLAIHDLDLALRIWDHCAPTRPSLSQFRIHSPSRRDRHPPHVSVDARLDAPSLPPLHLRAEWGATTRQRSITVRGTQGTLVADLAAGQLWLRAHGYAEQLPVAPGPTPIASEHQIFLDHLQNGTSTDNTLPLLALGLATQLSVIADENIPYYRPPVTAFPRESLAFQGQSVVAL